MYEKENNINKKDTYSRLIIFLYALLIANKNNIKKIIPIILDPKNFEKYKFVINFKSGFFKKK